MTLTVHHLQCSQSERIPWLCEELGISYKLVLHQRAPVYCPQSIKDLNPLAQAPVIQDGKVTLAESAACAEYIISVHGDGRLALPPSHQNYTDYLYWFHFANSNLQPHVLMMLQLANVEAAGPSVERQHERFRMLFALLNARLMENTWLAGDDFTAADIMTVWTLTGMRIFYQYDLTEYRGILAYLVRIVQREGYKKARAKADPGLELMIEGKPPRPYREVLQMQG